MWSSRPKHSLLPVVAACTVAIAATPLGCDWGPPDEDPDHLHHDSDGDGYCEEDPCADGAQPGDCDDADPRIHPGADEACNGLDDDCDGAVPDDEIDQDFDGLRGCQGDCDDDNPAIWPGATEVCNGEDDDCDGEVDEPNANGCSLFFTDEDEDGYGLVSASACLCEATAPHTAVLFGDCDDTDDQVFPGSPEACNGIDDNCNFHVDEGYDQDLDGSTSCAGDCDDGDPFLNPDDADGDGYSTCDGDCDDDDPDLEPADGDGDGYSTCDGDCDDADPGLEPADVDGDGTSTCEGDCDDADPGTYPGAVEICNGGVDDDCDPSTLEEADDDGDGYPAICDGPTGAPDCDDGDPAVFPGAADAYCDGVDGDCDGVAERTVPGQYAAIQDAIDDAEDGDVVCVSPGTYVEAIDFLGKAIEVIGLDGPASTVIDADGGDSVASFSTNEETDSVLEGFTLTGGSATNGGGVKLWDVSPTLRDLIVTGNTAIEHGGGLYLYDASPTMEEVVISDNESDEAGGMYLVLANPEMSEVILEDNHATSAGAMALYNSAPVMDGVTIRDHVDINAYCGIYMSESEPWMTDVLVADNQGDHYCGVTAFNSIVHMERVAVTGNRGNWYVGFVSSSSLLDFDGVAFTYNVSETDHGAGMMINNCVAGSRIDNALFLRNECALSAAGIYLYDADLTLNNVLIAGNVADADGGGMHVSHGSNAELNDVIVVGNRAGEDGGGIAISSDSSITMNNGLVVANEAGQYGGGIYISAYADFGTTRLTNVAITHNLAGDEGGGIYKQNYALQPVLCSCAVWGNLPDDFGGDMDDHVGSCDTVSVDPEFLDTSPADAVDWDLHLSDASPLIDAGDPGVLDPDLSVSDIGGFGGPNAADWDLDWDGFPLWWQPGAYLPVDYPDEGWDCDDLDPAVIPGAGC